MANLESHYDFRVANPSDASQIEAFLYDGFSNAEPLNRAFGLTVVDCGTFFPQIVKEAVLFPISMLALDMTDGSIAGCQLNTLYEKNDEGQDFSVFKEGQIGPSAQRLVDYLSFVDKGIGDMLPPDCEKMMKMTIVSVGKKHMRKGLCRKLKELTIAKAKEVGVDAITAESTSLASQAIMKKLGFTPIKTVALTEYDPHLKTDDGTTHTLVNFLRVK